MGQGVERRVRHRFQPGQVDACCPFLHQQFKPIILTKVLLVKERDDKEEISHWERRGLWGGWPGLFWFCFQYTGSSKNTHDSGPLVAAENFGER